MSAEFEHAQAQIQFTAQLVALHSKIKALKNILTEEQLKIYNESILFDKVVFLERHQAITTQTKETIDRLFS